MVREVFAKKLREARLAKGWTQQDLADSIDTVYMLIGKYENEKVTPRLDTVKRLADALGVTIGWLCGEEGLHEHVH